MLQTPYDINSSVSNFVIGSEETEKKLQCFTKDICVTDSDIGTDKKILEDAMSGGLFNITKRETVYAKSVNVPADPASLTKVLTALIAIERGNKNDILTASKNVEIKEAGVQMCGFKEGDTATLDQVLHALLIYSGNDAGVMIAEHIAGDTESFAKLMNERARQLGATNTNFTNPHGLTDELHKTTAYDMYLIFNEALKHQEFVDIISCDHYSTTYKNAAGNEKKLEFDTTNKFLTGVKEIPDGIVVHGGKTGTTDAAGACLILYSEKKGQDKYISVVLKADGQDNLYNDMAALLSLE